jgi:NDP-sugar pyrophosphorylase family protein
MIKNKKKVPKKRIIKNKKPKPIEENDLVSIIILADLPGYRMRSYGPTPLINLGNKYLIDLQIDCIRKIFAKYEIILCVGFDGDKITKHVRNKYKNINIRIVENQTFNHSNTCESLRLSINNTINNKLLIIDGGLLFNKRVLKLIDINCNCAIVEKSPSDNLEIGVNIDTNNESEHFSFGGYKTWSEIIYINDEEVIECLRKFLQQSDSKKKFIFEGLNDILKHGYSIKCIENLYPLYKINNIKTFHYIKENYEIFNI